MKKRLPSILVLFLSFAAFAEGESAALPPSFVWTPVTGLVWRAQGAAKIEKGVLTARLDQVGDAYAEAEVDLSGYDGKPFELAATVKAEGIADAEKNYLGFRFAANYLDMSMGGNRSWPGGPTVAGDFGPGEVVFLDRTDKVRRKAVVQIGICRARGTVTCDLSTLRIREPQPLVPKRNAGYKVKYPDRVKNLPRLRGVMLGGMKGDGWDNLRAWGANLVRYQFHIPGTGPATNFEAYAAGFRKNVAQELDRISATLDQAHAHGMKVVIDAHYACGGTCSPKLGDPLKWNGDWRIFHDRRYADLFLWSWEQIATRCKGRHADIYGYDLMNEANHRSHAIPDGDIVGLQERIAKAIRAIDPETTIIVESMYCDPGWFKSLSAIALDNVIYQVHLYYPHDYTHQGILTPRDTVHTWPDPKRGWNREFLMKSLQPVIDFQREHGAKMFCGEFSAIAWAPNAEGYIRDCISIFEELGWDWTYHAYREFDGWSVEKEAVSRGMEASHFRPSADNPRRRVLLQGLRGELAPGPKWLDVPWTTPGVKTSGRWHAEYDAESPLSGRIRCAWTSEKAGDSVELPFTGTAAGFRCRKGGRSQVWGLVSRTQARKAGFVEAFVDGTSRGLFDTETGARFEVVKGLPSGKHVLRLVNRGRDGADARVMVRCFLADAPQASPRNWEVEDPALAAEARALPPVAFVAEAPLESGAVPNAVWQSKPLGGKWGCALRIVEPAKGGAVRTVFAETNSLIYDLSLSYDATKALFSMRRNGGRTWQVYEIGLDGKGLRQLTDTPQAHNASPVYLADGRIAFVSSRAPRYHTVCQPGPCTHLHVMDADGGNVRRLSSNTLSDFNLCPLSDGRILYTRWSYVDWNLTYRQSLWTQYPDGRQLSLWFGNLSVDPASFVQAAELPDYSGVVALFAPHHRSVYGAIGSICTRNGPEADGEDSVRLWTPELPCIYDTCHFWSWCHPYPVARDRVVAARGLERKGRYVLALLAEDGRRATFYEDSVTSCFLPRPVVPRPRPKALADFVPASTNVITLEACPPGQPEREEVPLARILVSDVNKGLDGRVPRGAATHIRVMEQLPKTVNRTWNGVLDQGPLLGASSYYAKRVWSYAPIAEDGSAHLEVPALKEIYLQLVDAEGREIRRMTDALNLMPGETQSCTGCHEGRRTAAAPLAMSAARRAPTPITPPEWGNAGVLDYVRVVQPVWDRNCVRCHSGANPPKGLSLSGGYTRFFNMSYDNLVLRSKSDRQSRTYFTGQAKEKPLVQGLHLLYGVTEPYEVKESGSFASRLPDYLKKAHCGVEVSTADRRRVFEWIDAQIPYYATSDHAHVDGKSGRDRWGEPGSAALKPWFTQRFLPLYEKKCASCHGAINLKTNLTNSVEPQWWWFDLSRPEWSPALTAHLPKAAGGRGCAKFGFSGKDDPLYRELQDIAREASAEAWKTPEADMPGFVPLSRGKCEYRP